MRNNVHQTKTFDSLRAGLHVEDVDFKEACTPKLIDEENTYWRRIVDALEEDVNQDRATCNRLRIRRRQVLNGEHRREPSRGLPHAVAGAAAGVALFLGVAMWWDAMFSQPVPATRTASVEWNSDWEQPAAGVRAVSVDSSQPVDWESTDFESVEFANNIDFYTWLEKQSDTVADSGGG